MSDQKDSVVCEVRFNHHPKMFKFSVDTNHMLKSCKCWILGAIISSSLTLLICCYNYLYQPFGSKMGLKIFYSNFFPSISSSGM